MASIVEVRQRAVASFQRFFATEASGGIVLLCAAVAAVGIANSPLGPLYRHVWETPLGLSLGASRIELSVHHWINDGLMTMFFLVVGLEIKREMLFGELGTWRKAALPAVGALGGMFVPALIYSAFAWNTPYQRGWGIAMATDIAFAVGVLALLGSRVPAWLKVFVTALAIVDDIGAVLVIAAFYTKTLSLIALTVAAGLTLMLIVLNLVGVRALLPYVIVGIALWVAILSSGVHATIAGVILGMTIPAHRKRDPSSITLSVESALLDLREASHPEIAEQDDAREAREAALEAIEDAATDTKSPLHRLEAALHGWVAFLILPLFAFANAGVPIRIRELGQAVTHPISTGVMVGLLAGKTVGVFGAAWLAARLRLVTLPDGATIRQLFGAGALCGIGFTMSIFIANLAFEDPALLDLARIAIVTGSVLSAMLGVLVLTKRNP